MEILKRREAEIPLRPRIMQLEEGRVPGTGLSLSVQCGHCTDMLGRVPECGDLSPLTMEYVQEHDCIHLQEAFLGHRKLLNPHLGRRVRCQSGTLILMTAGPRA